jgi:hypothetical protein
MTGDPHSSVRRVPRTSLDSEVIRHRLDAFQASKTPPIFIGTQPRPVRTPTVGTQLRLEMAVLAIKLPQQRFKPVEPNTTTTMGTRRFVGHLHGPARWTIPAKSVSVCLGQLPLLESSLRVDPRCRTYRRAISREHSHTMWLCWCSLAVAARQILLTDSQPEPRATGGGTEAGAACGNHKLDGDEARVDPGG